MKFSRDIIVFLLLVTISLVLSKPCRAAQPLTLEQIFSHASSIRNLSYHSKMTSPAGRILIIKIWIKGDMIKTDSRMMKTGHIGTKGYEYVVNQWVASPGLSVDTVIVFIKEAEKAEDTTILGTMKIGGQDTTLIEYTRPRWDDFFNEMKVKMWISHNTLLPVKVLEQNVSENKFQTAEISNLSFEEPDDSIFDDIVKAHEQAKLQVKDKWKTWQEDKEKDYQRILKIDKDERLDHRQKADRWKSYLSSFCRNNPYSTRDDEMRSHARSRIKHWSDKYSKPTSSKEEIGRDRTFIAYANGVVEDSATGLEWLVGTDADITWNDAVEWIKTVTVDGGGWRMPTRDELKSLYEKGAGNTNMTPLLKTGGLCVWSGEKKDSSTAWRVSFIGGRTSYKVMAVDCNRCMTARVFAVRSKQ